jgi:pSer/pThr/pTyr-binding forkhead associated (FHA) protein
VTSTKKSKERIDPSATVVTDILPVRDLEVLPAPLRQIRVEVVGGPMDGLRAHVRASSLTMGRGGDNDLALPLDPMVSTRHARITQEGAHYWLEDVGSRNGTYFGDQKLSGRALVAPGSTFVVGQTCLEFMPH